MVSLNNVADGVYLASGSTQQTSQSNGCRPRCQSKYMCGVWHKPKTGPTQAPVIDRRGCEGCSADDGDGCKIAKGCDVNSCGVFKPTWERNGMSPDTLVW